MRPAPRLLRAEREPNKAATALKVSSATVSKILAGNWETIADEMWRGIAGQIGGVKSRTGRGVAVGADPGIQRNDLCAGERTARQSCNGRYRERRKRQDRGRKELHRHRAQCVPPRLLRVLEPAHVHGESVADNGRGIQRQHRGRHDGGYR